jgi:hypothetical protein
MVIKAEELDEKEKLCERMLLECSPWEGTIWV